jgi:ABC-2 type transport system ATP-binding protein
VERVCDKVGIIDHGKLIVSQNIKDLKKEYAKKGFEVKLAEDPAAILPAIRTCQWCSDISNSANEDNTYTLTVFVSDENQASQELLQIINQNGYHVLNFNAINVSLENIFIQLAGGETA